MSSLAQHLRFGARMLRRNPGFTFAAMITLALGIGANTAIFTVTNALLLRPFPYHEPQQLMSVDARSPTRVVSGMLYKISTHDFLTFAVVPVVFLGIAFFASYLPARRATRVDPTEALRHV